jgi:hypothetical protein
MDHVLTDEQFSEFAEIVTEGITPDRIDVLKSQLDQSGLWWEWNGEELPREAEHGFVLASDCHVEFLPIGTLTEAFEIFIAICMIENAALSLYWNGEHVVTWNGWQGEPHNTFDFDERGLLYSDGSVYTYNKEEENA